MQNPGPSGAIDSSRNPPQVKWTTGTVNSIIRRTIYRGFETFRKKKAKRKLRTGKSEYVWNDEDKIQTRESPHLRIVSDHLWYQANEVVDKRRVFQEPVRNAGHPLRGTTRQRRGPLAGVFVCGVCNAPMYSYGKKDGMYRCSAAAKGACWNRVSCMRERVYPAVLEAVVDEVLSLDGVRAVAVEPMSRAGQGAGKPPVVFERLLLVNAFHEPELVRHARLIVERRLEGKTYKEIAKELDLTKYHMENCARITRLMEEAGLPEPYRR